MKTFMMLGISLFLRGTSFAQCSRIPQNHAQLQWSRPATAVSPNLAWQVEVHPVLTSDENQTPVTLHSCRKDASWSLFTLERSAEVYWSPDSRHLLVINEPLSGSNKLLFFPVSKLAEGKETRDSDGLDRAVKQVLHQRLGENRRIEFYLPQFVSRKENNIVLAVGGAASSGGDGPMTPYCYGVLVDRDSLQVRATVSAGNLKRKFGAECQVSP